MAYTIKDILRMEVAPALGCTEPSAVALAAAAAASLLSDKNISAIDLWVDPNIYKNGIAVSIPGARGESGIDLAAALGVFGGDPKLRLEVLKPIDHKILNKAESFIKGNRVRIHLLKDKQTLFIRVILKKENEKAEAVIQDIHDNITSLKFAGEEIENHPLLSKTAK